MEICGDSSVYLRAFVNEFWLMEKKKERKKDKMDIFGITRLHERLGEL